MSAMDSSVCIRLDLPVTKRRERAADVLPDLHTKGIGHLEDCIRRTMQDYRRDCSWAERLFDYVVQPKAARTEVYVEDKVFHALVEEINDCAYVDDMRVRPSATRLVGRNYDVICGVHPRTGLLITVELPSGYYGGMERL